ncbi:HAD-IIA family hydrolase [Nocardioides mangrovicus]|uniref:HAD-IIA family hydrolase n=1 Tax=Nocardioides mangrovicus TaxID=2478913 RepID=A0A3L8P4E9_9ACTN|nr:HAD-IIA family hydrolase [Nocardioides mangrovicus]RLV50286.1 HAD-IIA family hydrolase [Nocardioides mangrovicus]
MLGSCDVSLSSRYDLAVLDLDGVVYVGPQAVPGAPGHLSRAREAGMALAFVTNNAARTPGSVAEHLRSLGVEAAPEDVVTSAQAASRLLAEDLEPGAPVYVIGGEGLYQALEEQGLRALTSLDGAEPQAVVQGYGPQMPWRQVVMGAILVARGLRWVATNTDATIPTDVGIGPGNGALVDLVARFSEREPEVAGKPESPLFRETLIRVGGERPLMVGDRLDTDILGARRLGWDSLVVLTGVTDLATLVAAPPDQRPTYVAADLAGLAEPQPAPEPAAGGERVELGGWSAEVAQGELVVSGDGSADDWWRVVASAGWSHLDSSGEPVAVAGLQPPAGRGH